MYETSSGEYMYAQCCTERDYGRIVGSANMPNFKQCMDLCMEEETGDCRRLASPARLI